MKKVNSISQSKLYEDFLLERDLFEFVDDLENFQSRHNKKKEYLGKKAYRTDLHNLSRDKLVLIAFRRNIGKLPTQYHQQYFNLLNHFKEEDLIQEITKFKKSEVLKMLKNVKF